MFEGDFLRDDCTQKLVQQIKRGLGDARPLKLGTTLTITQSTPTTTTKYPFRLYLRGRVVGNIGNIVLMLRLCFRDGGNSFTCQNPKRERAGIRILLSRKHES